MSVIEAPEGVGRVVLEGRREMARSAVVRDLLRSDEPSVRWKIRVKVLGEDPDSRTNRRLQEEIRASPRVRRLLAGQRESNRGTYAKWQGRHWVLMALADLGYPPGDEALQPIVDATLRTWLDERYFRDSDSDGDSDGDSDERAAEVGVPVVQGRHRRCASQQGGALLAIMRLGLADARAGALVDRLTHWQWPDGGWNCHGKPSASRSSVYETLLPLRGLAAFVDAHPRDGSVRRARDRAAEVLLHRRLLYRSTTGRPVRTDWARLHYPVYWRYDVLAALKGITEAGHAGDPRCADARDLLESKRLPDGGWAADTAYYSGTEPNHQGHDAVAWGPVGGQARNEWVTADALAALAAAR